MKKNFHEKYFFLCGFLCVQVPEKRKRNSSFKGSYACAAFFSFYSFFSLFRFALPIFSWA